MKELYYIGLDVHKKHGCPSFLKTHCDTLSGRHRIRNSPDRHFPPRPDRFPEGHPCGPCFSCSLAPSSRWRRISLAWNSVSIWT